MLHKELIYVNIYILYAKKVFQIKRLVSYFLCVLIITSLFGCIRNKPQPDLDSTIPLPNDSSSVEISWLELPSGVDISDTEAISKAFIDPLEPAGYPWFYSWKSIKELDSDDYISILAYYNYLNLPIGTESYDEPHADADLVEADLCKRFGVDKEYLRTSQLYNSENHTYLLLVGGGGPDRMVATSTKQHGKQITIEVAFHYLDDTLPPDYIGSFMPNNQLHAADYGYSSGYIFPFGTLIVELSADSSAFQYVSYKLHDEKYARHNQLIVS